MNMELKRSIIYKVINIIMRYTFIIGNFAI